MLKLKTTKPTEAQNRSSASLSWLSDSPPAGMADDEPYADVLRYSWISKMMKRAHANKLPWDKNTGNSTKSKPHFLCF